MDQVPTTRLRRPSALGIVATLVLAACSAGGSATAAPSASAVAQPSAAPTTAPTAAGPVSSGVLHTVDGTASGMVFLFHLPDGSFKITFENFSIASIAHTNVILVTNKDVTKDADIDKSAILDLGPLKGTSGMQDFSVPASADTMTYHTVVLWDTEMAHAIAAAALQ